MPFQNDIQNQGSKFNHFVTKYHLFKRDDMQMTEYTYTPYFLYDSVLRSWPAFFLTRYLRIDKIIH